MRKLDFPALIEHEVDELRKYEKQQTVSRLRLRVQFLRLLKTQEIDSIKAAAKVVGITPKCGYEWWDLYQKRRFDDYLTLNYKARRPRLSAAQQEQLIKRAGEENGFASQSEAQQYLADEFQICYTQPGVCLLFQRLKIKAKAPRPKNRGADEREQAEYKKTLSAE